MIRLRGSCKLNFICLTINPFYVSFNYLTRKGRAMTEEVRYNLSSYFSPYTTIFEDFGSARVQYSARVLEICEPTPLFSYASVYYYNAPRRHTNLVYTNFYSCTYCIRRLRLATKNIKQKLY